MNVKNIIKKQTKVVEQKTKPVEQSEPKLVTKPNDAAAGCCCGGGCGCSH